MQLIGRRNVERTHDAEPKELRIGQIPDALRQLRVLLLPRFVGKSACCAANLLRRIIPRTAARDVRIRRGPTYKLFDRNAADELFVSVRSIAIEHPLRDVAVHVVQSPWVRLFASDFLVFEITVLLEPRVLPGL